MATKIRLARGGSKKRPYYRIVVADSRSPRDGRYIERIGAYNPMLAKDANERITFEQDRVEHWLKSGAVPSERVLHFLRQANIGQDVTTVQKLNARHDAVVALKREEIEAKKKAEEAARKQAEAEAKAAADAKAAEEEAAKAAEAKAEEDSAEETAKSE